jgi:hypothetical protein|tara:strand:- start:245 stop:529 length:285 start_codon:yes stop_codon:yes gene_type:complete
MDYYPEFRDRSYHTTISTLFKLLALANSADGDRKHAEDWQIADDASQSTLPERNGFYGHINSSIVAIAGQEILDHWLETMEVDLTLASRNNYPL